MQEVAFVGHGTGAGPYRMVLVLASSRIRAEWFHPRGVTASWPDAAMMAQVGGGGAAKA
jgi:hypothetical protein